VSYVIGFLVFPIFALLVGYLYAITCPCWKENTADGEMVEIPGDWHLYGVWVIVCDRCGKKFATRSVFSRACDADAEVETAGGVD
jgi:hypothetical protein